MDIHIGILLASMMFLEGIVYVEEFGRKNAASFVWKKNYVCQIHGLREKKRTK